MNETDLDESIFNVRHHGMKDTLLHNNNFSLFLKPYIPLQCRDNKKNVIPESKTEEGSAKRNIVRKHDFNPNRKEKKQGGGGGGKGKWDPMDDGSM